MKDLKLIPVLLCALLFIRCDSPKLKIFKIPIDGTSSFLIGSSNNGGSILYTDMNFEKGSLRPYLTDLKKSIKLNGVIWGNYIEDSVIILIDTNKKVYKLNMLRNKRTQINLSFNLEFDNIDDLKIRKHEGNYGLFVNHHDSLSFINLQTFSYVSIFKTNQTKEYKEIASFDVRGDKLLISLKKLETKNAYIVDYYLGELKTKQFRKICSIKNSNIFDNRPIVCFNGNNSFYTSYYKEKAFLMRRGIDETDQEEKWDVGPFKIINLAVDKEFVYLNLYDKVAQSDVDAGYDEKITKGYSIYKTKNQ